MQCVRCLYSEEHPLNLTFDDNGLCSGCRIHDEKFDSNWSDRLEDLKRLTSHYRSKTKNNYDCIVPVSGARDSHFIVHVVKNVLGLNPLLVSYNKQYNTPVGARNLANLRIKFGCDINTLTVNPNSVKRVTRETLRQFGSLYWHVLAGETAFPVQTAVRLKIPLVIWGSHQGVEQVGMFSHDDRVEMTRKYRKEHDLMGYEADDLFSEFENLREEDLHHFRYPDDYSINRVGVRGIYLSNYIPWDSMKQHAQMVRQFGYETAHTARTFDYYNDVDSYVYSDLHDYLKDLKFGYTKVVDHACREIRWGRLTKANGARIVERCASQEIAHVDRFCDWLGVEESALRFVLDQHRNPRVWSRADDWSWRRLDERPSGLVKNVSKIDYDFSETSEKKSSSDSQNGYVLIPHGNVVSRT